MGETMGETMEVIPWQELLQVLGLVLELALEV